MMWFAISFIKCAYIDMYNVCSRLYTDWVVVNNISLQLLETCWMQAKCNSYE